MSVRYPSGATEFRMSDTPPVVGDRVRRNGQDWVVQEVSQTKTGTQVWLRPASEHDASE
jgi:hypothetical protein